MSESDNLPMGGNETAQPLTLDQAAERFLLEPEEDNQEEATSETEEVETDEAAGQETEDNSTSEDDGAESEEQGETDEASEPVAEPADDVIVVVNGEQITLADLKAGHLRQADYSRKTLEVAEKRKGLEAMSARVTRTVDAIADFLMQQIPAPPNPQLAMTNPGQFVQQKALHEAAVQQLNALLSQAGEVKSVAGELTAEQTRELLQQENAKLSERFPVVATDEGRKKFFDTASTAAKELGYTEQDIKSVSDHRMFALAHYAALGMQAEKAREKAKQKVQNAPPVAPQKARPQGTQQATARRNQDAMKRLARTGSIDDAMAIDFD